MAPATNNGIDFSEIRMPFWVISTHSPKTDSGCCENLSHRLAWNESGLLRGPAPLDINFRKCRQVNKPVGGSNANRTSVLLSSKLNNQNRQCRI